MSDLNSKKRINNLFQVNVYQPLLSEEEKLKNEILAKEFLSWIIDYMKLIDIRCNRSEDSSSDSISYGVLPHPV